MEKYEYLSVRWDAAPLGKSLHIFTAKGEIPKKQLVTQPSDKGDIEFMQAFARLGEMGWELVNVASVGDRVNFMSTGFFRRKITETWGE